MRIKLWGLVWSHIEVLFLLFLIKFFSLMITDYFTWRPIGIYCICHRAVEVLPHILKLANTVPLFAFRFFFLYSVWNTYARVHECLIFNALFCAVVLMMGDWWQQKHQCWCDNLLMRFLRVQGVCDEDKASKVWPAQSKLSLFLVFLSLAAEVECMRLEQISTSSKDKRWN